MTTIASKAGNFNQCVLLPIAILCLVVSSCSTLFHILSTEHIKHLDFFMTFIWLISIYTGFFNRLLENNNIRGHYYLVPFFLSLTVNIYIVWMDYADQVNPRPPTKQPLKGVLVAYTCLLIMYVTKSADTHTTS